MRPYLVRNSASHRIWFTAGATLMLLMGQARAQTGNLQPQLPPQAAPSIGMQFQRTLPTGSFMGSVPQGKATSEVIPLSLAEATARALRFNLGPVLADRDTRAARGARLVALSRLLPTLTLQTSESSKQANLAAFGFSGFPGVRTTVGPFSVFDTRAHLSQSILDWRSVQNNRAASELVKAADFSSLDTRDIVVLVVTDLYLQAVAGSSRVETVAAQVASADVAFRQAVDFKAQGIVPAIDVLRAQVELQTQRQREIFLRNEFEKQKLSLARAIGLADGQAFNLTDQVPFAPMPPLTLDQALARALETRKDYQGMLAGLRSAELTRKAVEAQRLPSLEFAGDYGIIGRTIGNSHGTYSAAVNLSVPIFQGGRVRGEILEARTVIEQKRAQLDDLRGRIGFEVRTAYLDLTAANDQVQVAQSAMDLAQQQLVHAQERFAAGVTNNLEVVQAQESVAAANENYISSLYAYNAAKAALGRAVGESEKTIPSFLKGVMP